MNDSELKKLKLKPTCEKKRISVFLPVVLIEKIEKIADLYDVTFSETVRALIQDGLDREED